LRRGTRSDSCAMPRRRRAGAATPCAVQPGRQPSTLPAEAPASATAADDRSERTAVFEKTKMCKFYLLGACAKGSSCRFAHFPSELQSLPDLACTKLCKTLIATGSCDNPECRYAHNREELRPLPFSEDPAKQPLASGEVRSTTQSANTEEEAFASAVHSTLLQIGHAAQVHAAEAARLQAAAVHLQALEAATAPSSEDSSFFLGGYGASGYGYSSSHETYGLDEASLGSSYEPNLVVKNTFLNFDEGTRPSAAIRPIASAAGRLCSMGEASSPRPGKEEGTRSAAMSRALADEPVQINLQSLRTMSSNSLSSLGKEGTADDWMGGSPDASMPLHRASRNPTSGSMQLVVEEDDEAPNYEAMPMPVPSKASPLLHPQALARASADEEKDLTPLDALAEFLCNRDASSDSIYASHLMDGLALEPGYSNDWMSSFMGNTPSGLEGEYPDFSEGWNSGLDGLSVKNTFLDFGNPYAPVSRLRAVQTAAGRLDLMAQQVE